MLLGGAYICDDTEPKARAEAYGSAYGRLTWEFYQSSRKESKNIKRRTKERDAEGSFKALRRSP